MTLACDEVKSHEGMAPILLEESLTFDQIDLDARLLRAIAKVGYTSPTLVQAKAIPLALSGKDIVAKARTGSGKTAAYCLPILNKILTRQETPSIPTAIQAAIMVPTRELAEQVYRVLQELTVYCSDEIRIMNLCQVDANKLSLTEVPQVVVSTPSKLVFYSNTLNYQSIESVVVDEADLVLSFGYDQDVQKLVEMFPKMYQSYLMSATLNEEVDQLKQLLVRNPAILRLEEDGQNNLEQYVIRCKDEKEKFLICYFLLKLKVYPFGSGKSILFVNDVDRCYHLKLFLEQFGIKSVVLNSELPVKSRLHIVQEFNKGVYDILIATDQLKDGKDEEEAGNTETNEQESHQAAPAKKRKRHSDPEYGVARGIDFQNVLSVINFDLPRASTSYTHRVGRTARGVGKKGYALSLLNLDGRILKKTSAVGKIDEEKVFARIEKKQKAIHRGILPFQLDMAKVQGFQYRVEDALRLVTKCAVKEARLKEIKTEILNSEKLKAHFEDNPLDLQALRHDKPIRPAKVLSHLRHVPSYLMPDKKAGTDAIDLGEVTFKGHSTRKRKPKFSRLKKKSKDPLKTFKA